MTTFTLTMVIVGALVAAGSVLVVGCAAMLLWTARRVGNAELLRGEIATLQTEQKLLKGVVDNNYEMFDSYRKRDAQRVSTDVQRRKRGAAQQEQETETPTESPVRQDLMAMFGELQ